MVLVVVVVRGERVLKPRILSPSNYIQKYRYMSHSSCSVSARCVEISTIPLLKNKKTWCKQSRLSQRTEVMRLCSSRRK